MTQIITWWNSLTRKERNVFLQQAHIKCGLSLYTWHCLKPKEQEQILNAYQHH